MVTRTGGFICTIGTTLPDDTNLLYNMYKNEEIYEDKRFFFTWEEVRDLKKARDEVEAKRYEKRVLSEIKNYGITSDYIQTQYYVSFKIQGDKFITIDQLKENNILSGKYKFTQDEIETMSDDYNSYIIAGLDTAVTNDYSAMIIGKSTESEDGRITNEVKEIIVFNKNKEKISPEDLMVKVADACHAYRIDSIIIDTTANQIDRAFYLYKELKRREINTQIIPYSYANQNKRMMMGYLEDSIYNQKIILPKLEYMSKIWEVKELIDELCYLKKEMSSSGVLTYKAPETSNCYDDLVMALAQFNYALFIINKYVGSNKEVSLGGDATYHLTFNKYFAFSKQKNIYSERAEYINIY